MNSAGKSTLFLLPFLLLTPAVAQNPMHQVPVRLELDKTIVEVTRGADVTYTVTLKNSANQPATAQADLKIEVVSPFGSAFPVVISQGQPSTTFHIKADQVGVLRLRLKAASLPGTNSLIVVKPPPGQQENRDQSSVRAPEAVPRFAMKVPKVVMPMARHKEEAARAPASAAISPPPPPAEVASIEPIMTGASSPMAAGGGDATAANHLQIFLVDNDPVAQDPTDHRWRARLYVAAFTATDTMADPAQNLPIHLQSAISQLDRADMMIAHGQQPPIIVATAGAPGQELVRAFATGMPVAARTFSYSSPGATKIKLNADPVRILSDGHTSATVQACLADYEDNPTTDPNADHAIDVSYQTTRTLWGAQLKDRPLKILKGGECSDKTTFSTFGHGKAVLKAIASGLQENDVPIEFFLPKSLLVFSALGGLLGGFARTLMGSLSSKWFANLWRNLVLGVVLGLIIYLLFLFGALSAIPKLDIKLANVPVQSGLGALVLGFVGGIIGRMLWPVPAEGEAPPAPPPDNQARPAALGG